VIGLISTSYTKLLAANMDAPKPEAPHFIIKGGNPKEARLPLIHTGAHVNISGVIADVTVEQIYVNTGSLPIEAIYVFPGSTKSAVYGMTMTVAGKVTKAVIKEKKEAKKEFEKAKEEGKSASLLEQQRPNVFQMNVANILPDDTVIVELKYTELLVPEKGLYEFVYPTVVAPRYGDSSGVVKEDWTQNLYTHETSYKDAAVSHTFDVEVFLHAGMPIQTFQCPSHDIDARYRGSDKSRAVVKLKNKDQFEGDRDYILRYRLTGDKIDTGLLLYEGEEENFFLMMMQPPKKVKEEAIPPREYTFIVDVSGSMDGFPLEISKSLMRDLIGNLKPSDRFNVVTFASGMGLFSKTSKKASARNVSSAIQYIDNQDGRGGTELLPALETALSLPTRKGLSRTVVLATDGLISVEKEAFDMIRRKLGDANMFAFGIGPHMNRYLIEGVANAGRGEPIVATDEAEARKKAVWFREYIQRPVLTDVTLDIQGFDVYDVEPLSIPDVFAERPVVVFGKWRGEPKGTFALKGETGEGAFANNLTVNNYKTQKGNEVLKYLWARERIRVLSDYNRIVGEDATVKKEVTALGLKYNLLTDYTSFLAIDDRNRMEEISQHSIGAAPEPHEWVLIILFVSVLGFMMYRTYIRV